jgi:hypothetical protein
LIWNGGLCHFSSFSIKKIKGKYLSRKKYVLRMDTREVYDYESVIRAKQIPGVRPIKIGKLTKTPKGDYQIVKESI